MEPASAAKASFIIGWRRARCVEGSDRDRERYRDGEGSTLGLWISLTEVNPTPIDCLSCPEHETTGLS